MSGSENRVLVYDVGGSHISAAVFDGDSCDLAGVVSASYPSEQSIDTFLNVLHSLGALAMQGVTGVRGASLAMPGPFDYDAGVSWMEHKLAYLYGFDLRGALAAHLGWPPSRVRFLNDAAAFLAGEVAAGAARGVSRVVGITLGTGVGSAFAVDGHVVREGIGVPAGGEIWNVPYQGGIVEDQISTRGHPEDLPGTHGPGAGSGCHCRVCGPGSGRGGSILRVRTQPGRGAARSAGALRGRRPSCWAAASRVPLTFFSPRRKARSESPPNCASRRSETMRPWSARERRGSRPSERGCPSRKRALLWTPRNECLDVDHLVTVAVGTAFTGRHWVAGGSHPPPAPTEPSVQISRTGLFGS